MKIVLALAFSFLLVSIPVVAAPTIQREAKITGYETGEFAVKGIVEQQLDEKVVIPLSKQLLANGTQSYVTIWVVGSANRIGISAGNDRLGKERAEEVKAFLSLKFPNATITTLTKGDLLDSKMVIVGWTISAPAPIVPKRNISLEVKLLFGLGTLALIAGGFLYWYWKNKQGKISAQEPPVIKEELSAQEFVPIVRPVRAVWEKDGEEYRVLVKQAQTDGPWDTPFSFSIGQDQHGILFRKNWDQAKAIVKGCMKNRDRRREIEELISSGVIKKWGREERKEVTTCVISG